MEQEKPEIERLKTLNDELYEACQLAMEVIGELGKKDDYAWAVYSHLFNAVHNAQQEKIREIMDTHKGQVAQ